VIEIASELPAGRALDLGCGFGRASIYLASLGWEVDAVDFVPEAIATAGTRAKTAGVDIRFHLCSVTDLGFLRGPYDLTIDVGCSHGLDQDGFSRYQDHLSRLLKPTGRFLLFARLQPNSSDETEETSGFDKANLMASFASHFHLEWARFGETVVEEKPPWPSGWFLWSRKDFE
jgi:cyclopropane fatty-acyl-phospholipid synthase-like methyltransferase